MRHEYQLTITWTGNLGKGTESYQSYMRSHVITSKGKPDILGSSDPAYRGDSAKWNPEELLLSALSSCHMLWYLHLCADHNIVVLDYKDQATAIAATEKDGAGQFSKAVLCPVIQITDASRIEDAKQLHNVAHEKCFIARSVNFPVVIEPSISS